MKKISMCCGALLLMGMVAKKGHLESRPLSSRYFHTGAQTGVMYPAFQHYSVLLNFNTRNQNHNIPDWTRIKPTVGLHVSLGK